jgi:hypothetical protein
MNWLGCYSQVRGSRRVKKRAKRAMAGACVLFSIGEESSQIFLNPSAIVHDIFKLLKGECLELGVDSVYECE